MNALRQGLRLANVRRTWATVAQAHPRLAWTLSTLAWLPLGIAVTEYFATVMFVTGRSMQPTLNPDDSKWRDVVLFDRFSVRLKRAYQRGDIVALKSPFDAKLIVKRIVALQGDVIKTLPPYPDAEVRVPEGHAWVEGDEPFRSEDSNTFGPVPLGLIDSRADTIVWPPDRFGPLRTAPSHQRRHGGNANGSAHGPAWRREMAEFERERKRQARVVVADGAQS